MATYSATAAHSRRGGQERAGGSEGCFALYGEPEKPTVRACGMRPAVRVTYRLVAPRSSSSARR